MIKWIIDYPSPFSENLNAIEWKGQAAHCEHQVYRLDSKFWTVPPRAIRVQEMRRQSTSKTPTILPQMQFLAQI